MARVPMWRRYLRFFGNDVSADVRDELSFHLETKIHELSGQGLSPEEARREAIRRFGDVAEVSALCQRFGEGHARRLGWKSRIGEWWYDTRYAARTMRLAPWFACAAAITLAAGIAGATSLFSVVEAWIIRAVRFPEPQQLVYADSLGARQGREITVSNPDYMDFAAGAKQLKSLAAFSQDFFTVSLEGAPERVMGARVSTNFLETLGVKPVLGRDFVAAEGEYGRDKVVIVSNGFWKTRLNGEKTAIGSRLRLNGESYLVTGVLPEGFHFTLAGRSNVWIPLAPPPAERSRRQDHYLQMVGRLKPGSTVAQAREELKAIAARLAAEHPDTNRNVGAFCISLSDEIGRHVGDRLVLVIFGVTLGLLLISCTNVANLLLVRALGRKKQSAIRMSLGASRARLVRQALVETLMLFLVSATAGALGGGWLTHLITSFIPFENRGYLPDYGQASLNWTVLGFVLAITLLTGLIFGLGPALEGSDANLNVVLKETGANVSQTRKAIRMRFALVVGQVIVATVLVSATAVLVRTLHSQLAAPMGFESSGVLTFRVTLDERQYGDPARVRGFFESLADSLGTGETGKPAISGTMPFEGNSGSTTFRVLGGDPANAEDRRRLPNARFSAVSPEFFSVLRMPILAGRAFRPSDAPDTRIAVVVNDAFVARYLRGKGPVGQSIELSRMGNQTGVIVGVVGEIREGPDPQRGIPQLYVPFAQAPDSDAFLMLRASGDPMKLLPAIRRRAQDLDPQQPIYDAKTLDERVGETFTSFRIASGLLLGFGILALGLCGDRSIRGYRVFGFSADA